MLRRLISVLLLLEAVDECIAENVLSEFLKNHREEVITVSIYEYDEEGHLEIVKEEGTPVRYC